MAVKRAFTICNQKYFLYAELEYLETVFSEINGYPIQLIKRTINECRKEQTPQPEPSENEKPEVSTIVLPYAGVQGELISKDINRTLRKVLDNKIKGRITFRSKKLKTCFQVKDRTEKKHQHNLFYKVKCPDCPATYIGEAGRRLAERVEDHGGRDKNSHVLKHALSRNHKKVDIDNFTIIGKKYKGEDHRKISEAFYIKTHKPTINVQKLSKPILLFN